MNDSSSKSIASKKKELSHQRKVYKWITIVVIALILFSVPWIIYQFIPEVSTVPGIGASKCLYPYTNQILIGVAILLSAINTLLTMLSGLFVKGLSHWKIFIIFEAVLLISTTISIALGIAACNFDPTGYF